MHGKYIEIILYTVVFDDVFLQVWLRTVQQTYTNRDLIEL